MGGCEPYQKNKIIESIRAKYKSENFEIVRLEVTEQNYKFLGRDFNSVSLFSTGKLRQLKIGKLIDVNVQNFLTHQITNSTEEDRLMIIFDRLTIHQQKSKWFESIVQRALYVQVK